MRLYSDTDPAKHGVSFDPKATARINPKHIDGPLLIFRDGQMHWLTLWERFLLRLGMTDAKKLERKRRPNLVHHYGQGPI
jgi:hypothetical protein